MRDAPIPLTLDLWSHGFSASAIAVMLGFPNHRHVARIIANARRIGDKRAVLHVAENGRLAGRPGRMAVPPVAIVVPALGKALCLNGHARAPENVGAGGHCLACQHTGNPNGRPKADVCLNGHPRTSETTYKSGGCKTCRHLKYRERGE